nr:MAG TPA: hypothetical protein [Caudoviricetes sp.]
MIPLDWFIKTNFGLDDTLIYSEIRNEFLLRSSTIQSNKDHLQEPSLCERSIHRADNSELKSFLNGSVIVKLVVESSHNHKNSVELDETLIRELTISDIHLNHFFTIR